MSNIFISHRNCPEDNEAAKSLAVWLKKNEHSSQSLFLDFDQDCGLKVGNNWEWELYRKLHYCQALIALVSKNWLESEWCRREVAIAEKKNRKSNLCWQA